MIQLAEASDATEHLIDPDDDFRLLAGGFAFTEGPVWDERLGALAFSDIRTDSRWSWTQAEGARLVARPNFIGNGLVLDREGQLLVCEHVTSSVVRIGPDGRRELVAWHFDGAYLNSPNDVVTRADGTVYFTDPDYGRWDHAVGVARRRELGFTGLFRVPPGGQVELTAPEDTFDQPNGLCFSPDETTLYVNDKRGIRAFEVNQDGSLGPAQPFRLDMASPPGQGRGDPDGMKCDAEGNIWCAGRDGIWILDPAARLLGILVTPEVVGNLAWGGPDLRTLFVCMSTTVRSLRTRVRSAPLPYHAITYPRLGGVACGRQPAADDAEGR